MEMVQRPMLHVSSITSALEIGKHPSITNLRVRSLAGESYSNPNVFILLLLLPPCASSDQPPLGFLHVQPRISS